MVKRYEFRFISCSLYLLLFDSLIFNIIVEWMIFPFWILFSIIWFELNAHYKWSSNAKCFYFFVLKNAFKHISHIIHSYPIVIIQGLCTYSCILNASYIKEFFSLSLLIVSILLPYYPKMPPIVDFISIGKAHGEKNNNNVSMNETNDNNDRCE